MHNAAVRLHRVTGDYVAGPRPGSTVVRATCFGGDSKETDDAPDRHRRPGDPGRPSANNLNPAAMAALERLSEHGATKTDVINRALQIAGLVQEIMDRDGGHLKIKRK